MGRWMNNRRSEVGKMRSEGKKLEEKVKGERIKVKS